MHLWLLKTVFSLGGGAYRPTLICFIFKWKKNKKKIKPALILCEMNFLLSSIAAISNDALNGAVDWY